MKEGQTFYPLVRALTRKHGTVLIYDEIVTGFRLALGGVQEYFGVPPDLAVFAKGFANGMPLSVYCGKAEIMEKLDKVIVSSTYGGETLSLASAKAAIHTYRSRNVIDHLWKMGERLDDGLNALFRKYGLPAEMRGFPPCAAISLAKDAPAGLSEKFYRAAYRNGVSLYGVPYVNFSHQETDIAETLERLENGLREL